jgi:hypothetical protein
MARPGRDQQQGESREVADVDAAVQVPRLGLG